VTIHWTLFAPFVLTSASTSTLPRVWNFALNPDDAPWRTSGSLALARGLRRVQEVHPQQIGLALPFTPTTTKKPSGIASAS
jgi:hypothetical protein